MQISSVKPAVVQHMLKRACGEPREMPEETLKAYFELKQLVHMYEFKDISVESGDMECIVLPFVKTMSDMFSAIFILIMQDAQAPLSGSSEAIRRMNLLSTFHHNFTSEDLISSRVFVGIYNEQSQKIYAVDTAVDLVQQSQRRKAEQAEQKRQAELQRQAEERARRAEEIRAAREAQAAQQAAAQRAREAQAAQRANQNFRSSQNPQYSGQSAQRPAQNPQYSGQSAQRPAQNPQYSGQSAQRPAQNPQQRPAQAQNSAARSNQYAQRPAQSAQRSAQNAQPVRRPAQVAYPDASINQQFE